MSSPPNPLNRSAFAFTSGRSEPSMTRTERLLQEVVDGIHELIALQRQPPPTPVLHNSPPPLTEEEEEEAPAAEDAPPFPQFPSVRLASPPLMAVPEWDLRAEIDKNKTAISTLSFKVGYSTTEAITFTRKDGWLRELGVTPYGDSLSGWHQGSFVLGFPVCLTFRERGWHSCDDIFIKANHKDKLVVDSQASQSMNQASPQRVLDVFKKVCHAVSSGKPALTLADTVCVSAWRFGGGREENHILPLTYVLNL